MAKGKILTGILGGTFDPIHIGHLRVAEEVRESQRLSEIWFIPAATPPHKQNVGASFLHRYEMVRRAIEGCEYFSALDIESKRDGPSYTIDTLKELDKFYGDTREFFFILGSDAFLGFDTWKSYLDIPKYANLVIMVRDAEDNAVLKEFLYKTWPSYKEVGRDHFKAKDVKDIVFQQVTHLQISSTDIRKKCKDSKSIRFLVPETVREYIVVHRLYFDQINDNGLEQKQQSMEGKLALENMEKGILVEHNPVKKSEQQQLKGIELVEELVKRVWENKGENIVVLDVRKLSSITDYFIITHGRSTRHVQGMVDKIQRQMRKIGVKCSGIEGEQEGKWCLMDYNDVVIHIFYEPIRYVYDLEGLWSQADQIEFDLPKEVSSDKELDEYDLDDFDDFDELEEE